jgi:hypothetical protein
MTILGIARKSLALLATLFCLAFSSNAHAQVFSSLRIIQDGSMWDVDINDGSYSVVGGAGDWVDATSFAGFFSWPGQFVIQDDKIWNANVVDGSYSVLSGADWSGPTLSAMGSRFDTGAAALFVVQASHLHRVDPTNGQYTVLGGAAWPGATSMAYRYVTGSANRLYIIQDDSLWRVSITSGAYTRVGPAGAWPGETLMAAASEKLFVVQGGVIHTVNYDTGLWTVLNGEDWSGATSMILMDGFLYVVQNSHLHKVNATTGSYTILGGAAWGGPTSMSAYRYVIH